MLSSRSSTSKLSNTRPCGSKIASFRLRPSRAARPPNVNVSEHITFPMLRWLMTCFNILAEITRFRVGSESRCLSDFTTPTDQQWLFPATTLHQTKPPIGPRSDLQTRQSPHVSDTEDMGDTQTLIIIQPQNTHRVGNIALELQMPVAPSRDLCPSVYISQIGPWRGSAQGYILSSASRAAGSESS